MRAPGVRWTGVVLLALGVSACGGAGAARAEPETAPQPSGETAAELEALYRQRIESARTRFTEADVRFMNQMIHHHAQALVMADLVPSRTTTPAVQTLAARIINAQRDEIASMQRWLRDRGQPAPEVHVMNGELMVHGAGHSAHTSMPGMLTDEQLAQLRQARGAEFDRLFLTHMIEHHRGAVSMVRELFATDGAGQDEEVFKFASDVQVDQATEIARMEQMLAALPGGGRVR